MDKTKENNIINFPDNNKTKKKNFSKFYILILIILIVIIVSFFNGKKSFVSTDAVNADTISILSTENYCFSAYKEGYIFAKDGKISCFNTNQQLQWEVKSSKTAPTVVSNENYVLTYYKKDKLAVVTNGIKTRKISTDGNVIFGSVNKNGYVTLLIEEDGFKCQLAVYDKKGKLKYKWHNSEKYITSAYLSDNNKTLVVTELNLHDTGVVSNILIGDIRKELKFDEISLNDDVICDLKFISKNKFIVVLDSKTVCYSTKKHKKWEIDYSSENLYTYDISDTNYISLVFGKDDSALSDSCVWIYNGKGKRTGMYESDKRIYKVDMQNKTSLIAYDREFEIINSNGKVISDAMLNVDIHDSIFIGNRRCALILSGSGASLIKPE